MRYLFKKSIPEPAPTDSSVVRHTKWLTKAFDELQPLEGKAPATKFDERDGKVDLSIVPVGLLEGVAQVLSFGAKKYGRDNYKGGMESHRLIGACLRHLFAWQNGEDLDKESSLNHLSHAAANIAMLLETQRIGTSIDTRTRTEGES